MVYAAASCRHHETVARRHCVFTVSNLPQLSAIWDDYDLIIPYHKMSFSQAVNR